ncbi:MAG TPA: methionyl-tRNA formyltransferase [Gammaproteobacteria bacterium]|jgi:methionyl-tRNA formyltransferase|nr:methionyl-tRNA formyltransferase [Gammaproteobacteria bacterium]
MEKSLNIIFAGTPAFAAVALAALLKTTHRIVAVYTQPDRPAGRGLHLTASPVKTLALSAQLPLFQPASLKEAAEQAQLADLKADVMVVAAYGLLLPTAVLTIPRLGCINIHPSLLPRWRGAAPIQRTIFAGDKQTGVTIMQMDAGLDTGAILLQHPYTLTQNETSQTLHDQLAQIGAAALLETLEKIGQLTPQPQDNQLATYAQKISKEEALLDWSESSIRLEQKIRAFNPWPVAYCQWHGERLRIWQAVSHASQNLSIAPGTLIKASPTGLDIATGNGMLRLLQVQLPGGKIITAADFYHARQHDLIEGQAFT